MHYQVATQQLAGPAVFPCEGEGLGWPGTGCACGCPPGQGSWPCELGVDGGGGGAGAYMRAVGVERCSCSRCQKATQKDTSVVKELGLPI
jgi:hypothetical protein